MNVVFVVKVNNYKELKVKATKAHEVTGNVICEEAEEGVRRRQNKDLKVIKQLCLYLKRNGKIVKRKRGKS